MQFKRALSYILILLCLFMVVVSEIPHHHHKERICMLPDTSHHHHDTSGRCKSCCVTVFNVYKKNNKAQINHVQTDNKVIHHHALVQTPQILNYNITFALLQSYHEKLHGNYICQSLGLRAPPFIF